MWQRHTRSFFPAQSPNWRLMGHWECDLCVHSFCSDRVWNLFSENPCLNTGREHLRTTCGSLFVASLSSWLSGKELQKISSRETTDSVCQVYKLFFPVLQEATVPRKPGQNSKSYKRRSAREQLIIIRTFSLRNQIKDIKMRKCLCFQTWSCLTLLILQNSD